MAVKLGRLDRDGAQIHWRLTAEDADSPLVVFTHGGAMDHRMWQPQVDAFSADYRVLTYDVRGHGLSRCAASRFSVEAAADDLVGLLDMIGDSEAVLVGHSVGASIAQTVALQHPERVTALVGIGAACITIPQTTLARARQAVNPLALGLLGQKRVREMFADMAGVNAEVKEYARHAIAALDEESFAAVMRTGFGRPYKVPASYELGVPLLVLQGDQEPYAAFMGRTAQWVGRDNATLMTVPNSAHNANQDSPGFVNGQIRLFLTNVLGETPGRDVKSPRSPVTD